MDESEEQRKLIGLPPKVCLMGLSNRLVPGQNESMTSIFEDFMYTQSVAKVSRPVTPELHIHYMYNWNWI